MHNFPITYSLTDIPGVLSSLSVTDLIISLLYVLLIGIILLVYRNQKDELEYRYFLPFFFFKTLCTLAFVVLYVYYYHGGDSVGFWSGSNSFIELAFKDFGAFIRTLFGNATDPDFTNAFIANNINYPSWILREDEGLFVSKIGIIFNLLSFKNYLATCLLFMMVSFVAQWKFYLFIRRNFFKSAYSKVFLVLLFIPSVSFWCSAISKDTIVLVGILGFSRHVLQLLFLKEIKLSSILWMLFYAYLLINVRSVIFAIITTGIVVSYLIYRLNGISDRKIRVPSKIIVLFLGFGVVMASFTYTKVGDALNGYLQEAQVVQQDFANNKAYTGDKYSISIEEYTIPNMILSAPASIISGLFRPFIWEAFSPSLILNGFESLWLTYLFLTRILLKFRPAFKEITSRNVLMFATVTVLLYAFSTGFTSVIFGVLVRLRAPLLLFFGILLYWKDLKRVKKIPITH